jgi:hypothetical protein
MLTMPLSATPGKLAVSSRARTCLLSQFDMTWQWIVEDLGGVAGWQSDKMAAKVSALRNTLKLP